MQSFCAIRMPFSASGTTVYASLVGAASRTLRAKHLHHGSTEGTEVEKLPELEKCHPERSVRKSFSDPKDRADAQPKDLRFARMEG